MNKLMGLLLAALLFTALPLGDALGRGFGGFGGARFGGGGFGGLRAGGFGGFRAGGFDANRFGGFRAGGFDRERFGGFRSERSEQFRSQEDRRSFGETSRPRAEDRERQFKGFDGASRTQLDKFLGMPTDAGLGHIGAARVRGGFAGSHVTAGRVKGPLGGSAAFISGTHVRYVPPYVRRGQGWAVRNSFYRHNLFTPVWYRDHRGAWIAAGVAAAAWAPATWYGLADWLDCDSMPEDYEYGSTVLYQGDTVYMEGQPVGSAAQYYDQASSLASSGAGKQDDQSQWMPLGVFALVQGTQTDPTMIFQLAVSHQGIIRGNFFNTVMNTTLPVHGAVDKKTQRVAWTVGNNKSTIFDTGLYNLTKDQAPALVHFGKDRTQEWLLVRLKGKDEKESGS